MQDLPGLCSAFWDVSFTYRDLLHTVSVMYEGLFYQNTEATLVMLLPAPDNHLA